MSLRYKFRHYPQIINSFALVLYVLILCHFSVFETVAQNTTFEIDTPAFIDTLDIRPTSVAFGDVNGDTLPDIVMYERRIRPIVMIYNPQISNFDSTNTHFLEFTNNNNNSITLINTDPQNRNREEIYFLNWNSGNRAFLWNDSQSPGFFEETDPVPSVDNQRNIRHTSIGDINNDGLPDIIIDRATGGFPVNRLISNFLSLAGQSAETLSDEIAVPIENSLSSLLADFNQDGFLDYFVMNDSGTQDRFFIGTENGFSEKLNSRLKAPSFSFSAAMGDFNNDGLIDIYRTNPREGETVNNVMFENQGGLEFQIVDAGFATLDRLNTRNTIFGDFDNDGDLDLLAVEFSTSNSNTAVVANTLYENLGGGNYSKRTQEPVMNKLGNWNAATFFDFNRDGQLDIIAFGSQNGDPIVFYKNRGNNNNWLSFQLEQSNGFHPEPYGARLTLTAEIDGDTVSQTREYNRLQGFQIQHTGIQHFGLGDATEAELSIRWPSGNRTMHSFSPESINQTHFITEPLAGRLSATTIDNNTELETVIGDTLTERFKILNIGNADVSVNEIESISEILDVVNFSPIIARNDTGFIDIRFRPFSNTQLGRSTDTLRILSDAVNSTFQIIVNTNALTLEAPFLLISSSGDPLLSNAEGFTKSYWVDLDGQQGLDPLLLRSGNSPLAFQGIDSSSFTAIENAITTSNTAFSSASLGDIDNDGAIDLLLGRDGGENKIYINNGDLNFEELPTDGLSGIERNTVDISLADLDGDSFLDIVITNASSQQNEILIQQQSPEQFESVFAGDFTNDTRSDLSHLLTDFDNDGLTDIFTFSPNTTDGNPVTFYRQDENFEFNQTPINGLTTEVTNDINSGIAFDLENDGDQDIVLLGAKPEAPIFIFRNDGNLSATRLQTKILEQLSGTFSGATTLDINRDGYVDLFLTNSVFTETNQLLQSINGEDFLRFTNGQIVTETDMATQSAVSPDINGNGREDIFITNQLDRSRLYLDNLPDSRSGNWVAIEPKTVTNFGTEALVPGTKINLTANIDGQSLTQTRIIGRNAIKSQALSAAVFGLGDARSATAHILFPDSTQIDLEIDEVNRFFRVSTEAVSTDNETETEIPREIKLNPSYPNPFNPTTTISFTLPTPAEVTLEIYSILGQKVTTLIDRRMAAGEHSVNFNAQKLPSGVYLSVLKAGDVQKVQKMTLIK